jgi:hypothetical protein
LRNENEFGYRSLVLLPTISWNGLMVVIGLIGIVAALWRVPEIQVSHSEALDSAKRLELINEYRRTLAQLLGGALLLIGLYATWQQISIAAKAAALDERRYIADRTDRTIGELVGNDNRLVAAAIVELGAIAQSSADQRCRIKAVLEGYVRESSSQDLAISPAERPLYKRNAPLVVLAIRQLGTSNFDRCVRLNLSFLDLRGLSLDGLFLNEVVLTGSWLDGTSFAASSLSGAEFRGASLAATNFNSASLWRATGLTKVQLRRAILTNALLPDEVAH